MKVGFDTIIGLHHLPPHPTPALELYKATSANQTQPNLANPSYKTQPSKPNLQKPNLTYQTQP